jgi:hypothetical protein
VDDYCRLRPDITVGKRDLTALAMVRDLPIQSLRKTVIALNRYASGQAGDPFGRTGDHNQLEEGQWLSLGPAKAYFTTTEGGVWINETFQALRADGPPIEGLYAIGSNGLSGMILWRHGLHIAWAITSGHMVGKLLGLGTSPDTTPYRRSARQ